jgi:uncharacterized protein with PQ loop repeat
MANATAECVGMAAAFLTTGSFVPQAIRVLKTRDTRAISLAMYAMFTSGSFFVVYLRYLHQKYIRNRCQRGYFFISTDDTDFEISKGSRICVSSLTGALEMVSLAIRGRCLKPVPA